MRKKLKFRLRTKSRKWGKFPLVFFPSSILFSFQFPRHPWTSHESFWLDDVSCSPTWLRQKDFNLTKLCFRLLLCLCILYNYSLREPHSFRSKYLLNVRPSFSFSFIGVTVSHYYSSHCFFLYFILVWIIRATKAWDGSRQRRDREESYSRRGRFQESLSRMIRKCRLGKEDKKDTRRKKERSHDTQDKWEIMRRALLQHTLLFSFAFKGQSQEGKSLICLTILLGFEGREIQLHFEDAHSLSFFFLGLPFLSTSFLTDFLLDRIHQLHLLYFCESCVESQALHVFEQLSASNFHPEIRFVIPTLEMIISYQ